MVRSQSEKDRVKDKRIQSKYGITLAARNELARYQDNKCKVCGGPLDAHGYPCIDHFHFKITVARSDDYDIGGLGYKWKALGCDERGAPWCVRYADTKLEAKAEVKKAMMPWSIRGLLCGKCNYGLGCVEKFFDAAHHPENLIPVMTYLHARLKKS